MKRVIKREDSEVIRQGLEYIEGRATNNRKLMELLLEEQDGFCAYTEYCLCRGNKKEIEHFNPNLKNTEEDNYYNWFVVAGQWNAEKGRKWEDYQPVLHPTDETLETRILYDEGDYILADLNDIEADNLMKLLKLDDPDLAQERKRYISNKKEEVEDSKWTPKDFFQRLIEKDLACIRFRRAIEEEFGIDLEFK